MTSDTFTEPGAGFDGFITVPDSDIVEDMIAVAPGAYAATAGMNSSNQWLMQVAAFKSMIIVPVVPITITFSAGQFIIGFSTALNQIYALQSTTNLAGGSWLPVVTNIAGTGSLVQIADTNAVSRGQRYYRAYWVPASAGYTITASASLGGTISPSGSIAVNAGNNLNFTATPNAKSVVNHWLLDNHIVQTAGTNYVLYNIQTNHDVHVNFAP